MTYEERMNEYYQDFSENDKYIASCILQNEKDCIRLTIHQFAQKYHVSPSALSRFAQKLQLSGYSELRSILRLSREEERSKTASLKEIVLANYHKMVEDVRKNDYSKLFDKIYHAERILIFASGYSQARAASEWKRIFLPLRKRIYYMHGHDMVKPFEKMAAKEDLVIILSFYGESDHVCALAENLRLKGVPTVSVTRMKTNSLAALCEENLYIQSADVPNPYGIPYEVTTPYFILIELLFIKYQEYLNKIS